MKNSSESTSTTTLTPTKKLRFRGEPTTTHSRIEDIQDKSDTRRKLLQQKPQKDDNKKDSSNGMPTQQHKMETDSETPSFMDFFRVEMTRGYILDHDEERYSARRQKIYSFIRIPRDVERFMIYGIMQCADSFLYIHTFLPVRFLLAIWALLTRIVVKVFRLRRSKPKLLLPAEICDLLKGSIWIAVTMLMLSVDTNRVYHIIKSQSIIKLYIFYNMLEVGDRLLSAFGQDSIDALFWTAAEQKTSKLQHFGLVTHIFFALFYVALHSVLIMFQATTLNVAVNSNSKGLLTIMISNNFVELKGSVFKKFDKNNLFQLSCSDVRERFHLSVLLFIVMIQTMKEFDWSLMQFLVMLPDCFWVLVTEILIDWVKHAFITRFNELPESIYREYTTSLAYDMTQTRQKHAFSDHSDLVARRMGFIPFPLAVVLSKAIYSAVSFDNLAAWLLFLLAYFFVLGLRMCLTICALGKACKLMKEHQNERSNSTPNSMTNVPPIGSHSTLVNANTVSNVPHNVNNNQTSYSAHNTPRIDVATSPMQQRSKIIDFGYATNSSLNFDRSTSVNASSTPVKSEQKSNNDIELDVKHSLELGATALFSNSDVDLDDVCLNENVLDTNNTNGNGIAYQEDDLARSEPDLQLLTSNVSPLKSTSTTGCTAATQKERCKRLPKRTHKRSESEPSMQSIVGDLGNESHA